jgi:hypothetical protein
VSETPKTSPQRMAAGYFLGVCAVVFVILLWLRGAGRFLLPLLAVGLIAVLVTRIVRALRAPLP